MPTREGIKRIIIINDNSACIPLFSKGGELKGERFIPVYKTGYSSSFLHKKSLWYAEAFQKPGKGNLKLCFNQRC